MGAVLQCWAPSVPAFVSAAIAAHHVHPWCAAICAAFVHAELLLGSSRGCSTAELLGGVLFGQLWGCSMLKVPPGLPPPMLSTSCVPS